MHEVWTFLRALNVALLALATFALYIRFSDAWERTSLGWRLIRVGTVLYFLAASVISAVRYVTHYPVDAFVLVPTVASACIITGAWLERHKEPEARP